MRDSPPFASEQSPDATSFRKSDKSRTSSTARPSKPWPSARSVTPGRLRFTSTAQMLQSSSGAHGGEPRLDRHRYSSSRSGRTAAMPSKTSPNTSVASIRSGASSFARLPRGLSVYSIRDDAVAGTATSASTPPALTPSASRVCASKSGSISCMFEDKRKSWSTRRGSLSASFHSLDRIRVQLGESAAKVSAERDTAASAAKYLSMLRKLDNKPSQFLFRKLFSYSPPSLNNLTSTEWLGSLEAMKLQIVTVVWVILIAMLVVPVIVRPAWLSAEPSDIKSIGWLAAAPAWLAGRALFSISLLTAMLATSDSAASSATALIYAIELICVCGSFVQGGVAHIVWSPLILTPLIATLCLSWIRIIMTGLQTIAVIWLAATVEFALAWANIWHAPFLDHSSPALGPWSVAAHASACAIQGTVVIVVIVVFGCLLGFFSETYQRIALTTSFNSSQLAACTGGIVTMLDTSFTIVSWNSAAADLTCVSAADAVGNAFTRIFRVFEPKVHDGNVTGLIIPQAKFSQSTSAVLDQVEGTSAPLSSASASWHDDDRSIFDSPPLSEPQRSELTNLLRARGQDLTLANILNLALVDNLQIVGLVVEQTAWRPAGRQSAHNTPTAKSISLASCTTGANSALEPACTIVLNITPRFGTDGHVDGLFCVGVDITDRVQVQLDILAAQHFAEAVIESVPIPLAVVSADNLDRMCVISVNRAFERFFSNDYQSGCMTSDYEGTMSSSASSSSSLSSPRSASTSRSRSRLRSSGTASHSSLASGSVAPRGPDLFLIKPSSADIRMTPLPCRELGSGSLARSSAPHSGRSSHSSRLSALSGARRASPGAASSTASTSPPISPPRARLSIHPDACSSRSESSLGLTVDVNDTDSLVACGNTPSLERSRSLGEAAIMAAARKKTQPRADSLDPQVVKALYRGSTRKYSLASKLPKRAMSHARKVSVSPSSSPSPSTDVSSPTSPHSSARPASGLQAASLRSSSSAARTSTIERGVLSPMVLQDMAVSGGVLSSFLHSHSPPVAGDASPNLASPEPTSTLATVALTARREHKRRSRHRSSRQRRSRRSSLTLDAAQRVPGVPGTDAPVALPRISATALQRGSRAARSSHSRRSNLDNSSGTLDSFSYSTTVYLNDSSLVSAYSRRRYTSYGESDVVSFKRHASSGRSESSTSSSTSSSSSPTSSPSAAERFRNATASPPSASELRHVVDSSLQLDRSGKSSATASRSSVCAASVPSPSVNIPLLFAETATPMSLLTSADLPPHAPASSATSAPAIQSPAATRATGHVTPRSHMRRIYGQARAAMSGAASAEDALEQVMSLLAGKAYSTVQASPRVFANASDSDSLFSLSSVSTPRATVASRDKPLRDIARGASAGRLSRRASTNLLYSANSAASSASGISHRLSTNRSRIHGSGSSLFSRSTSECCIECDSAKVAASSVPASSSFCSSSTTSSHGSYIYEPSSPSSSLSASPSSSPSPSPPPDAMALHSSPSCSGSLSSQVPRTRPLKKSTSRSTRVSLESALSQSMSVLEASKPGRSAMANIESNTDSSSSGGSAHSVDSKHSVSVKLSAGSRSTKSVSPFERRCSLSSTSGPATATSSVGAASRERHLPQLNLDSLDPLDRTAGTVRLQQMMGSVDDEGVDARWPGSVTLHDCLLRLGGTMPEVIAAIYSLRDLIASGSGDEVEVSIGGNYLSIHCSPIASTEAAKGNLYLMSIRDLTHERHAMETELKLKKSEGASEATSAFIARLSHELRNPLNGVLGNVQILLDTALTREQRDCLEALESSSHLLLTIIQDILDFSKVNAGGVIERTNIAFSLRQLVESAVEMVKGNAQAKSLRLATHVPLSMPDRLYGDPTRLSQILANLLSNAIKFTQRGEVVITVCHEDDQDDQHEQDATKPSVNARFVVSDDDDGYPVSRPLSRSRRTLAATPAVVGSSSACSSARSSARSSAISSARSSAPSVATPRGAGAPTRIRVECTDTGIGIDEDDVEKLFTPFFQADRGSTQPLHLQEVCQRSLSTPGKGTTFGFTLSTLALNEQQADVAELLAHYGDAIPKTRLLVVDENPHIGGIIVAMLRETGITAELATTVEEANKIVRLWRLDESGSVSSVASAALSTTSNGLHSRPQFTSASAASVDSFVTEASQSNFQWSSQLPQSNRSISTMDEWGWRTGVILSINMTVFLASIRISRHRRMPLPVIIAAPTVMATQSIAAEDGERFGYLPRPVRLRNLLYAVGNTVMGIAPPHADVTLNSPLELGGPNRSRPSGTLVPVDEVNLVADASLHVVPNDSPKTSHETLHETLPLTSLDISPKISPESETKPEPEPEPESEPEPEPKRRPKRRVLVVEDSLINQKLIGRNGPQGFYAILMDISMPIMDGFEATGVIRALEAGDAEEHARDWPLPEWLKPTGPRLHVPIVAITAFATDEDKAKCLGAGMDGFVAKPIIIAKLKAELERVGDLVVTPPAPEDSDAAATSEATTSGLPASSST
ncbi:sensor protein [Thecamonas trahens ATCC 50062]|uniref:Sensor protein n=1 Tax=Thecamonas trahens ATCC 50062 TaxID=461836 RepID=A0A0L0DRF1_THETB|nr:sensor protein [Thecamonas trahens ATCC 50062]KNC54566.1 sensor protein [Thecamonas trahens ATCC 50062]|eukprot:XP_013753581.1 sensor protein [Thecamonas trahens ATCC 50062]